METTCHASFAAILERALLAVSSSHHPPYCATSTAQSAHGFAPPGVSIQNIVTPTSIAGTYAWTTPNGNHMPRKLPDVPVLGSLLRQLKRTTTNVKTLLIHPRNVSAVVEQLRFRYGRPEQLFAAS